MPRPRVPHVHLVHPESTVCSNCRAKVRISDAYDTWVEVPLAEGWVASYRLVSVGERPVVAEIRVHPDDGVFPADLHRRKAGRWSADRKGVRARVPAGGLPGEIAPRGAGVTLPKQVLAQVYRQWEQDPKIGPEVAQRVFRRFRLQKAAIVPGRPGARTPDLELARLAARYVLHLGSRSPVKDLADELGPTYSVQAVKDRLVDARDRDLLTDPPPGRAGGELTRKAIRLLQRSGDLSKQSTAPKRGGKR